MFKIRRNENSRFEVLFKEDTYAIYDRKEAKEVFECYSQKSALLKKKKLEGMYA